MSRTCSAEDCRRSAHARGLCGTHYARQKRTGSISLQSRATRTCEQRDRPNYSVGLCSLHYQRLRNFGSVDDPRETVAQRIARLAPPGAGCWVWSGNLAVNGYGRLSVGDRLQYAHRVSYEVHNGPIPVDLTIDHLCRNRACVRPDHLEPVTREENSRREAEARRAA